MLAPELGTRHKSTPGPNAQLVRAPPDRIAATTIGHADARVATRRLLIILSESQVTAVRDAFAQAGYDGDLRTLPITSEDERLFVLSQHDVLALADVRTLEQVLQQLVGRKVWILTSIDDETAPFG